MLSRYCHTKISASSLLGLVVAPCLTSLCCCLSACRTTHSAPMASSTSDATTALSRSSVKVPFGNAPKRERALYDAVGDQFMIVSQGDATTRAARTIFAQGGNAIDAAAAASFMLAVERPQSTGVAGGGFMVIHFAKTKELLAIDFREEAPLKAGPNMFLDAHGNVIDQLSSAGGLASGVPGMVAGVLAIHEKYGRLSRAAILKPAIDLAEQGFTVYPHLAAAIAQKKADWQNNPAALALFFSHNNPAEPLTVGQQLRQPGLGKVLREISRTGRAGFYKGWVAAALIAAQVGTGGVITQIDLDDYQVKFRKPVSAPFGPYTVYSMPPPSSGGIHVIEMLNIFESYGAKWSDPYQIPALHATASAMQIAYFDRAKYLGDADFITVPLAGLASKRYAADWQHKIAGNQALHLKPQPILDPFKYESHETTHFTIADQEGNVVASTQTINGWFGSGVVVPTAGFVMNNQMDDFSVKPGSPNKFGLIGGKENAVAAHKRPLSSMSPTIVMQGDTPILALGSPSGSQIINCVMLTTLNYLAYRLPLWDSVAALRYHHQWVPDTLVVEKPGFSPALSQSLKNMGYKVAVDEIGCKIEAIAYENGQLHGVADPRGEGLAAGENPVPAPAASDTTGPAEISHD